MWTFMTSGVVAATIVGNIVNNVNNNNNNNNNNDNQDNQNNNNQNFNNDDNMNMNMNMVNMAMGKGFRDPLKNTTLITILCHLLTLHFTKQSSECARRVLCEANNQGNQSELSHMLQKTVRYGNISNKIHQICFQYCGWFDG